MYRIRRNVATPLPNSRGAKGSGAPPGKRNGNYRHGQFTREVLQEQKPWRPIISPLKTVPHGPKSGSRYHSAGLSAEHRLNCTKPYLGKGHPRSVNNHSDQGAWAPIHLALTSLLPGEDSAMTLNERLDQIGPQYRAICEHLHRALTTIEDAADFNPPSMSLHRLETVMSYVIQAARDLEKVHKLLKGSEMPDLWQSGRPAKPLGSKDRFHGRN